jgi:capsular exopolysaccharide synthesis family protein
VELRKYFNLLWRRKLIIVATAVVTIAVVAVGTGYITPVYQTSTVLRIAVSAGGSLTSADYMYADRLMNTYIEIATSRPVVEELVKRLDLAESPTLKAEIIPNTELIQITVEDVNPNRAAQVANTLADILITQENQLYTGGGKKLTEVLGEQLTQIKAEVDESRQEYEILLIQTPAAPEKIEAARQLFQLRQNNYASLLGQYEQAHFREEIRASMITVSEIAPIPQKPFKPRAALNLALAAVCGLVGGLALAFLFDNLDTTLHTIEDIETATKLTALAKIPKIERKQLGILLDGLTPATEAFRNLATSIQQSDCEKPRKAMLVMSAEPSQGKSMVVSCLAVSLAEFGKNVIAVDCDTRIPRLHSFFKLDNRSGLKDVLEQKVEMEEAIQETPYEGVSVLTSGSPLAHSSQMLASHQMARLIGSLSRKFDYVLLDSPALLAVADVSALAPNVSGFLLVVRREHARREAVLEATNFLTGLHDKFVALIVNEVSTTRSYSYYRYRRQKGWFADRFERIMNRKDWAKLISNLHGNSHGK